MADYTFTPPEFVEDQDAESIQERMMDALPADIDKTEGGFPWDFTMPTALEKAELVEYELTETLRLMHFMFAEGIYLDYHAQAAGLTRKAATAAQGEVTVEGTPETEIPAGFEFAVPASGDDPAIVFITTEAATIDANGTVTIPIEAAEPGTDGNVSRETITIMASPTIDGIETITNEEPPSGGTEEESDNDLRDRIAQAVQMASNSFCGCDADYKRWAMEIDGVGHAVVVPEWDGPGTVKVIITDQNGTPANSAIIDAVQAYIVSPDDRSARKAPIGATVTIVAPAYKDIQIGFTYRTDTGADAAEVIAAARKAVEEYLDGTQETGEINYNRIGSAIISAAGMKDYSGLTVNGQTSNIEIARDECPRIVSFTAEEAAQ
ncbi:MAG: baseplate J/gp47 family protein [Ruminococcus sp.]